jgi:peptide/nickel transport system substrate-binding protein
MTKHASGLTRRSLIKTASASALILPAVSLFTPALAQKKDRIILGTTQEPVQFNPLLYVNAGSENIPEACMFDALWDVNEKGEFIPNLAARIPTRENGDISGDGRLWHINPKRDVKWSDGQPFTAHDVEFTHQTIVNPKVAVRSRSGFDLIKTFKVVDPYTVEIELVRGFVPFMWAWQHMHIVPQHLLSTEADINTSGFNAQPIGTGPYLLKSRVAGSHMIYESNPNYHRGQARIKQFIHKFVPDQLVAYGQAKTGEIDYLGVSGVPLDRWTEAAKLSDRRFFPLAQPWGQFIYFNCGKPQFSDPKVRRALYIALEMQKSIDDIYLGNYKRSFSYLHTSHWAYNNSLKEETANPQLAARMLDEAGWKTGADGVREKNGVKLKFTMSTTSGFPARQASQALFQGDRRRNGDQEHAGVGRVGRIHDEITVRHPVSLVGADGWHGPRLYCPLPFQHDPGEERHRLELCPIRKRGSGPSAGGRRHPDRCRGAQEDLRPDPGDPSGRGAVRAARRGVPGPDH